MTINGITSSSYLTSLYGTGSSAPASGFAQVDTSSSDQTSTTQQPRGPGRFDEASKQAAMAKLSQTDPALAQKMEAFHSQVDTLKQSGASDDTIAQTMKTNMDSLTGTEKSELSSVFGRPPGSGAQGGAAMMQAGKAGGGHHHHHASSDSDSSDSSTTNSLLSQAASVYSQSQSSLDQLLSGQDPLALAA